MGERIKFGIVGCGVIGKLHAQQLKQIEDAEIVALADVLGERAEQFAHDFGGAAYSSYQELLKDSRVQVVSVCTPSGMHADMAVEAAHAGKHVIVEKPMDVTLQQADRMIRECRDAGVELGCIFQHRFDYATLRVKELLDTGKLGRIVLVNGSVHWYRSDSYYASGDWRGTWAMDGGGVLMNQAIHTVDLVRHFGGPIDEIYAHAANRLHPQIEVEDVSVATLSFRNGTVGTFTATTCAYPGLSTRVEIIGELGSCIIENNKLVYEHFKTGEDIGTHGLEVDKSNRANIENEQASTGVQHRVYGNAHYHQFVDFIEAIRSGRHSAVHAEEGRHALEIILGIYESAKAGRPVRLPLTT